MHTPGPAFTDAQFTDGLKNFHRCCEPGAPNDDFESRVQPAVPAIEYLVVNIQSGTYLLWSRPAGESRPYETVDDGEFSRG